MNEQTDRFESISEELAKARAWVAREQAAKAAATDQISAEILFDRGHFACEMCGAIELLDNARDPDDRCLACWRLEFGTPSPEDKYYAAGGDA